MSELLKSYVRYLGGLLGIVVQEQATVAIFELEEDIRKLARSVRQNFSNEVLGKLTSLTDNLEPSVAYQVLKAFTNYFQLTNLSEQQANIEKSKNTDINKFGEIIDYIEKNNIPAEKLQEILDNLFISPVFTAHPTEAKRRSILLLLQRIQTLLQDRENYNEIILAELICSEITTLWQSDEIRNRQPLVEDEIRNGIYYFENILCNLIPEIYLELKVALNTYIKDFDFRIPAFLKFGSWIGGDRDGNPFVTPEATKETLLIQHQTIIKHYIEVTKKLHQELSQSEFQIKVSSVLKNSLLSDKEIFPELFNYQEEQNEYECYRLKLAIIIKKLNNKLNNLKINTYNSPEELIAELKILKNSLNENLGNRVAITKIEPLILAIQVFGFHLATLDVREHSLVHEEALAEIFQVTNTCENYKSLTESEKVVLLTREILSNRPLIPQLINLSEETTKTVNTFNAISTIKKTYGDSSVENYIISMAEKPSDVLEVLLLAKDTGIFSLSNKGLTKFKIIPLFETIEDLNSASAVLDSLYNNNAYRQFIDKQGSLQEVMIGYSDSNKDGSYLTAHWMLYRTQQQIKEITESNGIKLRLFHGRGGTTSRGGGGPLAKAILAQPPGTVGGQLRVTEQGEMISTQYGHAKVAKSNINELISAVVLASLKDNPDNRESYWSDAIIKMADTSKRIYRKFVDYPGFYEFYENISPIRELTTMNIGSRPTKRKSSNKIEDLRAVPWVFGWTQNRCIFPTWYGMGSALENFITESKNNLILVREMYQEWAFFKAVLDNCEMTLVKSDMQILKRYSTLVENPKLVEHFIPLLLDEHRKTIKYILEVTDQKELLEHNQNLKNILFIRNHYLDPLSHIQVDLLKRYRNCKDESRKQQLLKCIQLSINGIASGMKNTG
jgi:phosphoenolpyruvate carboxylase